MGHGFWRTGQGQAGVGRAWDMAWLRLPGLATGDRQNTFAYKDSGSGSPALYYLLTYLSLTF